ncbi:MAG: hypothetical protein JKY87_02655 [Mariprofundus sp.]|nr:hypothetical protein [Mariprofundus sp.]
MIHKVGTNGQSGSIKKAIDYVLGEKDHNNEIRDRVDLLDGNPQLLLSLEKTMTTKNTYVHTSLSFTVKETEMINKDPAILDNILSSYKEQLAAGIPNTDASRLASITVRHDEADGKMHVHLIALRQDLNTGKSYQPFVSQRGDIKRFQDWNVTMQKDFGLENPNGIKHQQSASETKNLPEASREVRDLLDGLVRDAIEGGDINSRKGVISFLNNLENIEVSRQTNKSISIITDGHKRPIRLTGALYGSNFTSFKNIETEISKRASVDHGTSEQRLSEAMLKFAKSSHHKYETNSKMVGLNPNSHINSDINKHIRLDTVSAQPDDQRHHDHGGRQRVAASITLHDKQGRRDLGTNQIEPTKPNHNIFNGVDYSIDTQEWTWQGSYGHVNVRETEGGYALQHGSKMEWTMAAQLLKDKGITHASITCSSEQSMLRAVVAHKEAGIKIVRIGCGGVDFSDEKIKEIINEQSEKFKVTRDSITLRRTDKEGSTSSDIDTIKQSDEHRDQLIKRQIDNLEQASHELDGLINGFESELKYQHEQENDYERTI